MSDAEEEDYEQQDDEEEDEDYTYDDDDDDDVAGMTVPEVKPEKPVCLDAEGVEAAMDGACADIAELLCVSEDDACSLLRHARWNPDSVRESWCAP